jgi:exodeoxyribonuclease VII large subunit
MTLAGEGALLKMLEERKRKLAAEGLFLPENKKRLPYIPNTIGVITSPTGAVIKDIMHRIEDRFPRHVLLWPVTVQGDQSSAQVIDAINGFENINQNSSLDKPEVIIIARGGGSLEDLMPFNDEQLVRTAANCSIPIISAIGHETDTTLLDLVADIRAPTPTGAAEMAVPVRQDVLTTIRDYERKISNYLRLKLSNHSNILKALHSKLGDPHTLIGIKFQHLDHTTLKLKSSYDKFLYLKNDRLKTLSFRLLDPKRALSEKISQLGFVSKNLTTLGARVLQTNKESLLHSSRMLESLSFHRVLERGYAVVRDTDKNIISSSNHIEDGQKILLEFKEKETLNAIVDKKS